MAYTKPSLSIIIPSYQRASHLIKTLEGFARQEPAGHSFEIIVVDDGSSDDTAQVVDAHAQKGLSIQYISQEHAGPAVARNTGVKHARAPLILFTGDDCIPAPRMVTEHLRAHREGKAIAVLGHIDWDPEIEITPFMRFITIDTQFSYPKIRESAPRIPYYYFYTSNISLRKDDFLRVEGFDEAFRDAVFEDVELGYRLWKSGIRIVYRPRALTLHSHPVTLTEYLERQTRLGRAAARLYATHPELTTFLKLPRVSGTETRYRFYQAALDYHYLAGLQERLSTEESPHALLPLKERMQNWSDAEHDRLAKELLEREREWRSLRKILANRERRLEKLHRRFDNELRMRDGEIARRDREIAHRGEEIIRRDREVAKRDKTIDELDRKNRQYYGRIVALEKFELRVKSSISYRLYRALRHAAGVITRRSHSSPTTR